jgi:cytochrome b involved in lipid metabolism
MKKLTTISLFIFGVLVTAILSAGLVFYQDKKDNQVMNSLKINYPNVTKTQNDTIKNTKPSPQKVVSNNIILNMAEIGKHNNQSDCWMLINGKVYDITSFFGSHPGGNGTMISSCGRDATDAYMTKDPNASSSGNRSAHSSRAVRMLADYYVGDFNQVISQ